MSDQLSERICNLFESELEILIPDVQTDLIEDGLLDSLVFVELIVQLETHFEIEIPIAELEFDQFRTVAGIAAFILSLQTEDCATTKGSAA